MEAPHIQTVYVVDDDPLVLRAIGRLLRSAGHVVQAFSSSARFLDQFAAEPSHGCLILDLAMPGIDGLGVQDRLARLGCLMPIIFLTGHGDVPSSVGAMKRGAADFLTKPADSDQLLAAVRSALAESDRTQTTRRMIDSIRSRLSTLTPREYQVLVHVTRGRLNKQIAADLGTVEKTIKVHRARVMEKMGVHSSAELARLAERVGITDDDDAHRPDTALISS